MNKLLAATLAALMVTFTNNAQTSEEPRAVAEDLSPKLRGFLQKEMQLLAEAGTVIATALEVGDSKTVEGLASQIHESFIMKKELTTMDLRELQAVVGEGFIARDKAFHDLAYDLAEAAKNDDKEKQKEIFWNMVDVCAACHAAYAPSASVLQ